MAHPLLIPRLKVVGQKLLPDPAYGYAVNVWRTCCILPKATRTAFQEGIPDVLLYFGVAPGDDLMCTAVVHELRKRGRNRVWMMSNHASLFEGNRDVVRVVPVDFWYQEYVRLLHRDCHVLKYSVYDRESDRSQPSRRHVLAEMCARVGIQGEVAIRPYFYLKEAERERTQWARGMLAIHNSGLAARLPMRNKEWFPERFQEVVDALRSQYEFVQVGSESDPPLRGVRDLRGKSSLRETAAVLSNARLFIGLEGFLMHLSRAVECPAVILFGGRTAPWQLGYSCNVNLYSPVPCAPCWLWNTCAHDRICMQNILASAVVDAVESQVANERRPLAVDTARLQPTQPTNS